MGGEHPKWGLDFDQYFQKFERRLNKAFDNYMSSKETTSVAHDGLPPLSLIETMLTVGDNMHKLEYQHGEKALTVLMATVRRYTEIHNSGIFDYYYGYLCMRHIMRMICIGTLIEGGTLEEFLSDLDPKLHTVEATVELAGTAFSLMTQALLKEDIFYVGLSFEDVEFLTMTLWSNRRRLITLIKHGMLPGFPALLFTLCEMAVLSKSPGSTKKWTQLQDILIRAYLVGTMEERKTLRHLSLYAHTQIEDHNLIGDSRTDEEDACTIAQAYVEMFDPIRNPDKSLAPVMLLDIANILFQFVDALLTPNLEEWTPKVAWGGLERIWLEIDRESGGPMAPPRRGFTRRYAADIFQGLSDMQRRLRTRKNQQAFLNMLMEIDILGL
ncbi:hypothetical protein FRC07_002705, partial [Ceratobasidium sp. 392]